MATILELAELSSAAYGPAPVIGSTPLSGWTIIMTSTVSSDGYQGVAYQNSAGQIVIANRGTDPSNLANLLNNLASDAKLSLGGKTQVQTDAVAFALLVAAQYGGPIIETGHSLGGNEAQAATVALTDYGKSHPEFPGFSVSAVTFNSPGIGGYPVTNDATSYNVLNLYDQGDAIHLAGGAHLGNYGTNGLVMMPAGPNTASLAWGTVAAGIVSPPAGIALFLTTLYNTLLPAHSLPNTVVPYLQANPLGTIGWSASGPNSTILSASSTGPTMSVNAAGALVLTDASGNSVALTASVDNKNINATFSGGSSLLFQQMAALGTVTIPAAELSQAVTGLTGATTLNETITRDSNIPNTFIVTFQNAGSTNPGDKFKVSVTNPASIFNYTVPSNGHTVVETINSDNNGSGEISVNTSAACIPLTGGTPLAGKGNTWTDSSGDQYQFTAATIGSNIGKLTISQGLLGSGGNQIVINNFDLHQAETTANGYLGIKFGEQLAIVAGVSQTSPFVSGKPISQTANAQGNTQTVTVYGQAGTVQLACAGSGTYEYTVGTQVYSLANGPVTLTIPTGQNSVTVTLIDTTNTSSPDTATLTATTKDASGNTVTSNSLSVTFASPNPNAGGSGVAANTLNGDLTPQKFYDAQGNVYYKTDALGNYLTDGTASPNQSDILFGSTGNDVINGGGGNNLLIGMGGNDTINGGSGSDFIVSGNINADNYVPANSSFTSTGLGANQSFQNYGGNGKDVINGGGGQDIILAGNGSNQIYANAQITFAAALAQQATATATGQKGDLIAVGDGNNTVVGGNGNDAIAVGTGNNTLVLGGGNNVFEGGIEVGNVSQNWNITNSNGILNWNGVTSYAAGNVTAPSGYKGNTLNGAAVGTGNDTIYGGTGNSLYFLSNGNNWLDAGGGNDFIQAGTGNSTIFSGTGNDSIFGGGGSNAIYLESGYNQVALQGGNNTVIGGSGPAFIHSGDASSNWANSGANSTNYIQSGNGHNNGGGGWGGATIIWGSAGHDTLISGSDGAGWETDIIGGNGNEYIVGGAGADQLQGGAGVNTIYAGTGNNIIQLSASSSETSTVNGGAGNYKIIGGGGNDSIIGGADNDCIFSNVLLGRDRCEATNDSAWRMVA